MCMIITSWVRVKYGHLHMMTQWPYPLIAIYPEYQQRRKICAQMVNGLKRIMGEKNNVCTEAQLSFAIIPLSFKDEKKAIKRLFVNIQMHVGIFVYASMHATYVTSRMPLCIVVRPLYFPPDETCISWPMAWRSLGRSGSHWLSHSP